MVGARGGRSWWASEAGARGGRARRALEDVDAWRSITLRRIASEADGMELCV